MKKYDEETKQKAIDLYTKGIAAGEVGRQLGVNRTTIQNWMNQKGISRHRGPQSKIGNENYFDRIDCERKAYFLGWLMADGCMEINNGQYSIKIHIGIKDKHIVKDFLDEINADYKLKIKNNKSVYVSITSKLMCESLLRHGICPRKSGKEIFPDMDDKLERHFIRGYFDGDGITDIKSNKRSGFIAPQKVLREIQKRLGTNLKEHHAGSKNSGMFYFISGRKFSIRLYKFIYKDATIWINRKRERLNIICGNTEITNESKKSLAS